eukprot:6203847-Pleurochrysis_carterae.AAC.2
MASAAGFDVSSTDYCRVSRITAVSEGLRPSLEDSSDNTMVREIPLLVVGPAPNLQAARIQSCRAND